MASQTARQQPEAASSRAMKSTNQAECETGEGLTHAEPIRFRSHRDDVLEFGKVKSACLKGKAAAGRRPVHGAIAALRQPQTHHGSVSTLFYQLDASQQHQKAGCWRRCRNVRTLSVFEEHGGPV